jgi:hypothetical protein
LSAPLSPARFRERYALAAFADGGVVVDLETGSYARLNASAAALLSSLEAAETTDAATAAVAARFQIDPARARADLDALSRALELEGARIPPIEPFEYRPAAGGGYDLWHGERWALHVDAEVRHLTLGAPDEPLPLPLFTYVSDMAPKLVSLLGTPVLHGSSWSGPHGVLGLCGKSKAGKTTTARTLARHGGALVSEDLIVLAADLSAPRIHERGEAQVHAWEREAAALLSADPSAAVDVRALQEATTGPTLPFSTLWFLSAQRRGDTFTRTALTKAAALTELMSHEFLGAAGNQQWRRFLAAGQAIVDAVASLEAALPLGLERLDAAMAGYVTLAR